MIYKIFKGKIMKNEGGFPTWVRATQEAGGGAQRWRRHTTKSLLATKGAAVGDGERTTLYVHRSAPTPKRAGLRCVTQRDSEALEPAMRRRGVPGAPNHKSNADEVQRSAVRRTRPRWAAGGRRQARIAPHRPTLHIELHDFLLLRAAHDQ